MSIIRNTASGLMKGRVGNTTFYVMNGQQVARQARNNSNYGDTASRSYAQQARRVKWSNLVNLYKACKDWMPKAFENKKRSQSDYNKFMSVNVNASKVSLTKDQALNGSAVIEPIIMSQGSLPQIASDYVIARDVAVSDIKINLTLTSSTPIAQLANDIIANNPTWSAGDNLALILFSNGMSEEGFPFVLSYYYEFTLDTSSTQPMSSLPISRFLTKDTSTSCLAYSLNGRPQFMACMFIHTRKSTSMLLTSTQRPVLFVTSILDQFSTQEQLDLAIESYGVSSVVPLDPTFSQGRISSVSVNGVVSPYISGSIIQHSGSASIVISGSNLNERNLYLEHDGMRYTPIVKEDGSWTYLLGENGVNKIYINGFLYGGIEISGVVRPSELSNHMTLWHFPTDTWVWTDNIATKEFRSESANWPELATDEANGFLVQLFASDELDEDDFECGNGVISDVNYSTSQRSMQIKIVASTAASPTYLKYKGYIIAIFNYHN